MLFSSFHSWKSVCRNPCVAEMFYRESVTSCSQFYPDTALICFAVSDVRDGNCPMLGLSLQWMGSGPCGAAGAPAPCPAGEAAGREHVTAQTQPHSLGVTNVKEMTYKLIFVTVIPVQVSVLAAGVLTGLYVWTRGREPSSNHMLPWKWGGVNTVRGISCLAGVKASLCQPAWLRHWTVTIRSTNQEQLVHKVLPDCQRSGTSAKWQLPAAQWIPLYLTAVQGLFWLLQTMMFQSWLIVWAITEHWAGWCSLIFHCPGFFIFIVGKEIKKLLSNRSIFLAWLSVFKYLLLRGRQTTLTYFYSSRQLGPME